MDGPELPAGVPAKTSGQRKGGHTTPQLSCELCRERKIKCDKREPCSNCVSHGAECIPVHRLRLPRGRYAHRSRRASPLASGVRVRGQPTDAAEEDVQKRLEKLEMLISSMASGSRSNGASAGPLSEQFAPVQDEGATSSAHVSQSPGLPASLPSQSEHAQSPVMSRSDRFWEDLAEEIHWLRGVIDPAPGEADEDIVQTPNISQADSADDGVRVLGFGDSNSLPPGLHQLDPSSTALCRDKVIMGQLCQVYLQQVDPIIKVLHRPTLSKWLIERAGYLGYPEEHPSTEALRSAVCYAAVNSMTERQFETMFRSSKDGVVAECRRACEAYIEKAGLLATRDITVLQAFVLYLFARRSEDRSRAVSTLVAVAVRIAKSLCLHLDPTRKPGRQETFFQQQVRKRLWLTICLIDLQAASFQGGEPLISPEEVAASLPLVRNVNDSDFATTTVGQIADREDVTDMTFALVTYHLQLSGRLLNFHAQETGGVSGDEPERIFLDWEARREHGRRFEQVALGLLHFCDPESSPYAWHVWHGTQCLVAASRLTIIRPLLHTGPRHVSPPPRMEGETELLRLAVQVLEKAQLMLSDPRAEGFRWYVTIPWPVLAVAIAECCVCSDVSLLRRSWPVIEGAYQLHEAIIARFSGGILRGPLGKLMRQARDKLAPLLRESHGMRQTDESLSASVLYPDPITFAQSDTAMKVTPDNTARGALDNDSIGLGSVDSNLTGIPGISSQEHVWTSTSGLLDGEQSLWVSSLPDIRTNAVPDFLDQSWRTWEDFITDLPLDDAANFDVFHGSNMNGF